MEKYSKDIEPRRLRFPLPGKVTKFWHNGQDIYTYHFNAVALFLPLLENLVVLSLKNARKENLPLNLKAQLNSLIAQEALHGSEFHRFNQRTISQHYPLETKQVKMRFFRAIARGIHAFSSTFHYGFSAAGEHITAISSDLFLRQPSLFKDVEPTYSAIWRWHCIEEIEHKTVAYDVFEALNGNYFVRILTMIMITFQFSLSYVKPIFAMMRKDRNHLSLSFYYRAFKFYWAKEGICRKLFKPYLDYYKPSFHPKEHDNLALIEQWKAFFKISNLREATIALQFPEPPKT